MAVRVVLTRRAMATEPPATTATGRTSPVQGRSRKRRRRRTTMKTTRRRRMMMMMMMRRKRRRRWWIIWLVSNWRAPW